MRDYLKAGGGIEWRKPRSWREAHKVLHEYEGCARSASVIAAGAHPPGVEQLDGLTRSQRRQAAKSADGSPAAIAAAFSSPEAARACFSMRDSGVCAHGSSCKYSHDPTVLAQSRSQESAYGPKGKGKSDKSKGKGKGDKGKKDGKGKDKGK